MDRLLIKHIGTLVTPLGDAARRGPAMREIRAIRDCSVLVEGGRIAGVFEGAPDLDAQVFDAGGALMTPGLVDAHTHLVFGGWRQHELARRLSGESYMDILKSGGGILSTVRATREAGEHELFEKSLPLAREMLQRGVTSIEAKSGYGLDIETELRQLRVARRVGKALGVALRTTYLGAHAVPQGMTAEDYARFVIERALPEVARSGLADDCDVFCEQGVFDVGQSRAILRRARELGLGLRLHADEMVSLGGAQLAAELGALSADHLIAADVAGIEALAASDSVCTLLPQTSLYLGKPFARARQMIDSGCAVALASDFNPGSCPSNNLHLSINLGLICCRMTPAELLCAVTLNGAAAIGLAKETGSIEPGKRADLVLWDAPDWDMVCYRMGGNLVKHVFAGGQGHSQV